VPEVVKKMRAKYSFNNGTTVRENVNRTSLHRDYGLDIFFGHDMLVLEYGMGSGYYRDFEPGKDIYTTEWGIVWKKIPYKIKDETGYYTEIIESPLANEDAITRYKPPDPEDEDLSLVDDVLDRYGKDYFICGHIGCSTFEALKYLRGITQSLLDLAMNRDLANKIMDISVDYHTKLGLKLIDRGVDMLWLSDDIGGQHSLLMSPETFRELIKPKLGFMIQEFKNKNKNLKVAFHSDGNIEPVIDDLIEIGVDILNPIQPESIDPYHIKKKYGKKLTLWGTVSVQNTLPFKTALEVENEVRERISICGAGGGFILSPTHNVQLDVPMENIEAFYRAAVKYGSAG
jgi:uroporphyrinogen decarboxylase